MNRFLTYVLLLCGIPLNYAYPDGGSELADSVVRLDEVSVTAMKLGNDLRNAAQASTVLGRFQIEQNRMQSLKSVAELAPNFYIPDYGSRMTSSIYVRGIGARIDQPAVGLSVDNVSILSKDGYDFDIMDLERAEILRGPQSALYGRNTMGGIVNLYTLSPFNFQGLKLTGEYSGGDSYKASAGYYAVLGGNLGFSVSGNYASTGGFFTNAYTGEKCDFEDSGGGRMKLHWIASDRLSVFNTFAFSALKQGGYPYAYIETGEINYNDECSYERFCLTDGLTVKYNTPKYHLSAVTSFQYIDDDMALDQDFLPLPYFTLDQRKKEYGITEDIVVKGAKESDYKWLFGAYAFYKHSKMQAPVTFKDYGINNLIVAKPNEMNPDYQYQWESSSFALGSDFTNPVGGASFYHQSKYERGDWRFSAGIRIDYEHAELHSRSFTQTGYDIYHILSDSEKELYRHFDVDIDERNNLESDFLQLSPQLSALYKFGADKAQSVYASFAKGYKSGGFNTQMFSDVLQQKLMKVMGIGHQYDIDDVVSYKPEYSWNYELGAHFECNGGTVLSDVSAFYIDCRDQQLTIFPDGTTTGRIMANAGKTRSFGAEFSMQWNPVPNLNAQFAYGYTNAKFVRFDNGADDYAGKYLPYAPQNTLSARASYRFDVSSGFIDKIIPAAGFNGVGRIYWDEANSVSQPFYCLLGASVKFVGKNCSLDLWARNLTNTRYDTFYFVSIGHGFVQRGKPAVLGATLKITL